MKGQTSLVLPVLLALDLLIPCLLAPSFRGYDAWTQVMSVLGSQNAPLHKIYNTWLVLFGVVLAAGAVRVYPIVSAVSSALSTLLAAVMGVYAVGGCILSGLFSVGESKSLATLGAKIHGWGAAIGFLCLVFAPLLIGMYFFKISSRGWGAFSLICFFLAAVFFVLFIMADKPVAKGTALAWEGLWQRLSLLCMYLPIMAFWILHSSFKI